MRAEPSLTPTNHDTTNLGTASYGRAWRLAAAMALAALCGLDVAPGAAQGAMPCTVIENDAERLACYDRALRPSRPAAQRSAPAAAPPATPAASPPPAQSREPRQERRPRESTAPPAPAAPAPPAAGQASDADIVPIVVVSVRALPGRGATFTTQTGEIWIQTDSQRTPLPDAPFTAAIKRGAMSSYFLVPEERGRAVRVRRGE